MAQTINAIDVNISLGDIVVGCTQTASLKITREMNDAQCKASGNWKSRTPGVMEWTGSLSALYREFTTQEATTNVGVFDIFEMLTEGTLVDVEYGRPETGAKRFHGQAYVSGLAFDEPLNGVVTWSADLTGDGAVTIVTNP